MADAGVMESADVELSPARAPPQADAADVKPLPTTARATGDDDGGSDCDSCSGSSDVSEDDDVIEVDDVSASDVMSAGSEPLSDAVEEETIGDRLTSDATVMDRAVKAVVRGLSAVAVSRRSDGIYASGFFGGAVSLPRLDGVAGAAGVSDQDSSRCARQVIPSGVSPASQTPVSKLSIKVVLVALLVLSSQPMRRPSVVGRRRVMHPSSRRHLRYHGSASNFEVCFLESAPQY